MAKGTIQQAFDLVGDNEIELAKKVGKNKKDIETNTNEIENLDNTKADQSQVNTLDGEVVKKTSAFYKAMQRSTNSFNSKESKYDSYLGKITTNAGKLAAAETELNTLKLLVLKAQNKVQGTDFSNGTELIAGHKIGDYLSFTLNSGENFFGKLIGTSPAIRVIGNAYGGRYNKGRTDVFEITNTLTMVEQNEWEQGITHPSGNTTHNYIHGTDWNTFADLHSKVKEGNHYNINLTDIKQGVVSGWAGKVEVGTLSKGEKIQQAYNALSDSTKTAIKDQIASTNIQLSYRTVNVDGNDIETMLQKLDTNTWAVTDLDNTPYTVKNISESVTTGWGDSSYRLFQIPVAILIGKLTSEHQLINFSKLVPVQSPQGTDTLSKIKENLTIIRDVFRDNHSTMSQDELIRLMGSKFSNLQNGPVSGSMWTAWKKEWDDIVALGGGANLRYINMGNYPELGSLFGIGTYFVTSPNVDVDKKDMDIYSRAFALLSPSSTYIRKNFWTPIDIHKKSKINFVGMWIDGGTMRIGTFEIDGALNVKEVNLVDVKIKTVEDLINNLKTLIANQQLEIDKLETSVSGIKAPKKVTAETITSGKIANAKDKLLKAFGKTSITYNEQEIVYIEPYSGDITILNGVSKKTQTDIALSNPNYFTYSGIGTTLTNTSSIKIGEYYE